MRYIVALDQGTTSSRCIIFDEQQNIVCARQKEFSQYYPKPGWVEHNPAEIFSSQYDVLKEAVEFTGLPLQQLHAIGITNQRETTIVWEKDTGLPIYNAIVWQCRRTADICEELKKKPGFSKLIQERTGLVIDAYFSATKVQWILDHVEGARKRAERGELLFGTVDTWLLWNLTGGEVHKTDLTNASRTMMFNINTQEWDDEILDILRIPKNMLPEVVGSSEIVGHTHLFGQDIPIAGMAGDQHAALFGQCCFAPGETKNTYGTGCFMLMNTGDDCIQSKHGLLTTLAATANGELQYVLEGSVFVAGAAIQWLRDELGLIKDSQDSEYFATKVADNGGVYLVPAFTGLGAPHWDMYARGTITGLTRGSTSDHIVRAALESIAYQSRDVLLAMQADTDRELGLLRVDGGASANDFLMQFQADISKTVVERPRIRETTALGAAYLAGLATGIWDSTEEIAKMRQEDKSFSPAMPENTRKQLIHGWDKAVGRSKGWAEE